MAARWPPTSIPWSACARADLELLCPGHGPWIEDPTAKIDEYLEHRLMRERRLLAELEKGERSRARLLDRVWDDVPRELRPAAAVVMRAHLEKLEGEGRLPQGSPTDSRCWSNSDAHDVELDQRCVGPRERLELATVSAGGLAKRFGLAGAALAALAGTTAAGLWHQLFRRPLPRDKGSLRLDGLEQAVEIRRDRWGVPHIRAKTRHDLWFAEGFCHGQDRLWQLDLYRRIGSGRLAEIAGRPGLQTDRFMRTLGLRRAAEREAAALQPELRSALDVYCAGVNAAAADRPLPAEFQLLRIGFEAFMPADSLLLTKLLSFGLSTNWERELLRAEMARELGAELAARLDPGYPRGNPVILTPGEAWTGDGLGLAEQIAGVRDSIGLAVEAGGSNNWAVTGARSATGAPLLAGDPHLPPSMPGITYQVGLYLE